MFPYCHICSHDNSLHDNGQRNRHRERDAEEMHQRWVDEERFWEDVGDEESEFGRLGGDGEL